MAASCFCRITRPSTRRTCRFCYWKVWPTLRHVACLCQCGCEREGELKKEAASRDDAPVHHGGSLAGGPQLPRAGGPTLSRFLNVCETAHVGRTPYPFSRRFRLYLWSGLER